MKKINEARQRDGQEEVVKKEDDDPQLFGEAKKCHDLRSQHECQSIRLEDRVGMLNADQMHVSDNIKAQKLHEDKECSCAFKPLHNIFVSRVGGTGKSFLIEAIKDLVGSIWSIDDLVCAIAAPTGLAAFNVGGITIHRLFQLPIEHIQQRQLAIGPCQKPLRRS